MSLGVAGAGALDLHETVGHAVELEWVGAVRQFANRFDTHTVLASFEADEYLILQVTEQLELPRASEHAHLRLLLVVIRAFTGATATVIRAVLVVSTAGTAVPRAAPCAGGRVRRAARHHRRCG